MAQTAKSAVVFECLSNKEARLAALRWARGFAYTDARSIKTKTVGSKARKHTSAAPGWVLKMEKIQALKVRNIGNGTGLQPSIFIYIQIPARWAGLV